MVLNKKLIYNLLIKIYIINFIELNVWNKCEYICICKREGNKVNFTYYVDINKENSIVSKMNLKLIKEMMSTSKDFILTWEKGPC